MSRKTRKILIWSAIILTIVGLLLGLFQGIWILTGHEAQKPWWSWFHH